MSNIKTSKKEKIGYVSDLMGDSTGFSYQYVDKDGFASNDWDIVNDIFKVADKLRADGANEVLYSFDSNKTDNRTIDVLVKYSDYTFKSAEYGVWEGFGDCNTHVTLTRNK